MYLAACCQDSTAQKPNNSWNNFYLPCTLLRIGGGYQRSFFGELGFTRRKYGGEDLFVIGTAYYGSIDWAPKFENTRSIYGLKLGGEITTQPFLFGVEAKYQTNFVKADYMITPKIGIGEGTFTGAIISSVFLCYGYNFSINKYPFTELGGHQFSIVWNGINLSSILNRKKYLKKFNK
jgi:hypothetical protein